MAFDQPPDRATTDRVTGHRTRARQRHPLVHERGDGHPPPFPDRADPSRVGHPHVGEEHFVELGVPGDLHERPDLDTRRMHVEDEIGESAVLGLVRIGAGDEHPVPGGVGDARPHLLPVDHPFVAVADGLGREAGNVGTGAGLAEELAPDLLAGGDAAEVVVLLFFGAPCDDGGPAHPDPDDVGRTRHRVPTEHLVHRAGLGGCEREPGSVLRRPRRGGVAGFAESRVPGGVVEPGAQLGELRVVAGVDRVDPAVGQVVAQPGEGLCPQLLRGELSQARCHLRPPRVRGDSSRSVLA